MNSVPRQGRKHGCKEFACFDTKPVIGVGVATQRALSIVVFRKDARLGILFRHQRLRLRYRLLQLGQAPILDHDRFIFKLHPHGQHGKVKNHAQLFLLRG